MAAGRAAGRAGAWRQEGGGQGSRQGGDGGGLGDVGGGLRLCVAGTLEAVASVEERRVVGLPCLDGGNLPLRAEGGRGSAAIHLTA